jgi:dTDP-4-amino-4,6-dideoxygalactose transaminase
MSDGPAIPQANPGASYVAQRAALDAAVAAVLAGGRYILGETVARFEAEFASYLGVRHCVGVGSGTDAIELGLRALEVGPGQAVIAPSHTAVATVAAIEAVGARPVLIDVDPITCTITAAAVEDVVRNPNSIAGSRVAAVIPVHLYGHAADMPAIVDVAKRHGLRVIEDCAQSHGARIGGARTGTFGDLAAFSFYPTKNLGAFGDAGLVATNDTGLRERLVGLREYGWRDRYVSAFPGTNSRLDALQAAILSVKLARLDADNERRRATAARYTAGLAGFGLGLPTAAGGVEHVFHQYVIRTSARDDLAANLASRSIHTGIHYPVPVHLQPAYRDRGLVFGDLKNVERSELKNTEGRCQEILSLPMFPQLADADVDRVIAAITQWSRTRRRRTEDATT